MSHTRRIVIIGGPKTGKTTLSLAALVLGQGLKPEQVRHTDATKDLDWSKASEAVVPWFDEPGPWVIEGVAAVRALRKWLAEHKEGKPCDELRVLTKPFAELIKGQAAMTKGIATILKEIEPELAKRGVEIEREWPEIPADVLELARSEASRVDEAKATHAPGGSFVAPSSSPTDATPVVLNMKPGAEATFGPGGTFPDAPAGVTPPPFDTLTEDGNLRELRDPETAFATATLADAKNPLPTIAELDAILASDGADHVVVTQPNGEIRAVKKSDSMAAMPTTAAIEKDPATLSVHELQDLNAQKERDVEDAKAAAELAAAKAREPKADATRGDKRAKQWWKDRPWKDGPNGSTGK